MPAHSATPVALFYLRPARRRRSVGVANATHIFTVPNLPFGSTTAAPDDEDKEEEGSVVRRTRAHVCDDYVTCEYQMNARINV